MAVHYITRDEIITDYKTKAVMMHTREGTTIVTQQEKVTNAALGGNYNLLIHCSARTRGIQTG